jgi:hypothetical protein
MTTSIPPDETPAKTPGLVNASRLVNEVLPALRADSKLLASELAESADAAATTKETLDRGGGRPRAGTKTSTTETFWTSCGLTESNVAVAYTKAPASNEAAVTPTSEATAETNSAGSVVAPGGEGGGGRLVGKSNTGPGSAFGLKELYLLVTINVIPAIIMAPKKERKRLE